MMGKFALLSFNVINYVYLVSFVFFRTFKNDQPLFCVKSIMCFFEFLSIVVTNHQCALELNFTKWFLISNFRGIGPNDLALLRVKTPFTYTREIQPVKLPEGYKMGPESLTLTGWGVLRTTVFFPDLPSKLQEVAVTYIPYQGKDALISNIRTDTDMVNPYSKMWYMNTKNIYTYTGSTSNLLFYMLQNVTKLLIT